MLIKKSDFEGWCNCGNFPYQKCGECELILGDVTTLKENEVIISNEEGDMSVDKRPKRYGLQESRV